MQGNITGLYDIGCVLGSIMCYFIGERFGRRTMLMTGGFIMIIGAALLGSSYTVAQLLVGRIVTGFGNGMNSSTAPVYQSECSPASIRGALLTLQGTVTILGVVIAYWTDFGTNAYTSSFQWRFPLSLQAVFAVFLILQIAGLPETPRWLVAHDRHEEARAVIAAITDRPVGDADVARTVLDIQSQLEEEHKDGPFRVRELFAWGELQNLRRLLIIISVQLGQQFSGSNMINYYLPVILQGTMGLSRTLSLILSGCAQCTYLIGSAIPVLLMDRYGRRVLLMACSAGLCICFVMVSILLSVGTTGAAYAAVAFIFIFQLVCGVGWLPVPWFYPSELTTTRVRSRMQSIASGWNWMAVFAVVKITPISFGKEDTCLPLTQSRREASYESQLTLPFSFHSQHRVEDVYHICRSERLVHPNGLFLLPGDQGSGARGHTAAVQEGGIHRRCLLLAGQDGNSGTTRHKPASGY